MHHVHHHLPSALRIGLLAGVLALAGCDDVDRLPPSSGHDHDHGELQAAGRLVYATTHGDHGHVHVIDLADGSELAEFGTEHPVNAMHRSPDGRHAVLIQRDGDTVGFLDGGLWAEAHGDHAHYYDQPPQLLGLSLQLPVPAHYQSVGGDVALFFDGRAGQTPAQNAGFIWFGDAQIGSGAGLAQHNLASPLHGVAVPRGEFVLATTAADTVTLFHRHGDHFHDEGALDDLCPRLHGSASTHDYTAFGCENGVLVVDIEADFASQFIDLAGVRITQLLAHDSWSVLVGRAGADLYLIDPAAGSITPVDWSNGAVASVRSWAVDAQGAHVVLLDSEGTLHIIDSHDWTPRAPITELLAAGSGGVPMAFSGAESLAFIADAGGQRIRVVDLVHAEVEAELAVGAVPAALTWVGVIADADDHDHDHDH